MTLLMILAEKAPYLSESEREDTFDLLRAVEADVGAEGIVAPKAVDTNGPLLAPAEALESAPPVGPVAEPVPPGEQGPPPVTFGGDTAAAGEVANAFGG